MNMHRWHHKISKIFILFAFFVFANQVNSNSYPSNTPTGEVEGGYFYKYFQNIFGTQCGEGMAIVGFTQGDATDIVPYRPNTRGKPICQPILAVGFTGSMVGSGGYLPVYNETGTGLVNSWLSQGERNLKIKFPNFDMTSSGNQGWLEFVDQNNKRLGYIGDGTFVNALQVVANNDNDLFLTTTSGATVESRVYLQLHNQSRGVKIARSGHENWTTPARALLDLYGNIRIADGSQGTGKILVSDTDGVASWKQVSDIFQQKATSTGEALRIPMWDNSGEIFTGSQLKQFFTSENNHGVASEGDFYIGKYMGIENSPHLGKYLEGPKLMFEGTNKHSDFIYLQRIWRGQDANELRMVVGDNAIHGDIPEFRDRFTIGATDFVQSDRGYIPQFTFLSNGKLGIKNENPTAELDIKGKIKIADGSQGSGKVLVSDGNGLASWQTASLGGNPNDCSATNKTVNGHNYPIIALTNDNSFLASFVETIPNGQRQWTQRFVCIRGSLSTSGGESSAISCNNGYQNNGSACVRPSTSTTSRTDCDARTMSQNGRQYRVDAMKDGFSFVGISTSPIANGIENFKQTFACDNAVVTPLGSEEKIGVTCNAGYAYNGSACVAGGQSDVQNAYSGTLCNTANIQIVDIAPGTDKIPEHLNADTLYRLSAGEHNISKQINMNNCTAVIGAGTGATTVGYAGVAHDSVNIFNITQKNDTVIMNLKVEGQKSIGKAKNGIKLTGTNASQLKTRIENVEIRNLTHAGIDAEYMKNSVIKNVVVDGVNSEIGVAKGIHIKDLENSLLEKVVIQNFVTDRIEAIVLKDSVKNNSFLDIDVKNIVVDSMKGISFDTSAAIGGGIVSGNVLRNINMSSISANMFNGIIFYSSYMNFSNNTFTKIHISNISGNNKSYTNRSSFKGIHFYYSYGSGNIIKFVKIFNISNFNNSLGIEILSSSNASISRIEDISISNVDVGIKFSSYGRGTFNRINLFNLRSHSFIFGNRSSSVVTNLLSINSSSLKIGSFGAVFSNVLILNARQKGLEVQGKENTFSNLIIANSGEHGIFFDGASPKDNKIHNFVSYNNGGAGVYMNGSNNLLSNGYIYNNGGKAVDGAGNSNFYFNRLTMFGNAGGNTATPLHRGLGSFWREAQPLGEGQIVTTGTFASPAWTVFPTNVSGFNPTTRGYQPNLTWNLPLNWSFGANIPRQLPPLQTGCLLSKLSAPASEGGGKCTVKVGDINSYNATKKIGQP